MNGIRSSLWNYLRTLSRRLALFSVILLFSACDHPKVEEPERSARFKFVEDATFGSHEAQIFLDTETGVKYLYIWGGGPSNGGPAITRLWEK